MRLDVRRRPPASPRIVLPAVGILAGCTAAPTQNVLGSFFPSWLICVLLGIAAAIAMWKLLDVIHVADQVPLAPLVHTAFAVGASLLIWLVWFSH